MRTMMAPFLVLILLPAAFADETAPLSFFARSPHYSVALEMKSKADGTAEYNVTVIDLATNTVVMQPHLSAPLRSPATSVTVVAGVDFHLRVGPVSGGNLALELDVSKGNDLIDLIRTFWITEARPISRTVGGVTGGVSPTVDGYYRVGRDVYAPHVIKRVEPSYNATARRDGISGIVIIEAKIDENGKVRDTLILKDLPDNLGQAAADAIRQWEFTPGVRDGKPVPVIFNLTVDFKLNAVKPQP